MLRARTTSALQGKDAARAGGARDGRVSGAYQQPPRVDGRLHARSAVRRAIFAFLPSAAALCLVRHQVYTKVTISSL